MDEEYTEDELKALKTTHNQIETAIGEHMAALELPGFLTGWIVTATITSLEEGEEFDGLYQTHSDGLTKWSHIGMLVSALDSAKEGGYSDE